MWKIAVDLMPLAKKSCEVGDAVKLMKWSKHAKDGTSMSRQLRFWRYPHLLLAEASISTSSCH